MSLYEFNAILERMASSRQIKGIILHLRGLQWGMADAQTLRDTLMRFRKKGKKVVAYSSTGYDLSTYVIATAADEILMQPMSSLNVCGLQMTFLFLKDALAMIGVQVDVIASHPYKTAGDSLSQNEPSPEFTKDMNKFLDSRFDILVEEIAEGRKMDKDKVRAMIDGGMYVDHEALELKYVDGIVNEEQLPRHLDTKYISTWEQAKSRFSEPLIHVAFGNYVALIRIEGIIGAGDSSSSPFDLPVASNYTGDITAVQQIRRVTTDKSAAALILYVDSPGGDANASEAITAALRVFNKERPVVIFMNNVAASGGYLVATASRWIVAQPGTITGSIGAVTGKLVDEGLFHKLHMNRVTFSRGENANMLSAEGVAFTDAQRTRMREMLEYFYKRFESLVGKSRGLTQEQLDEACQGRIWTGKQALDCGLIDELGGLDVALNKARELAKLPVDAPLIIPEFRKKTRVPPAEVIKTAAAFVHVNTVVRTVGSGMTLFMMPYWVQFK